MNDPADIARIRLFGAADDLRALLDPSRTLFASDPLETDSCLGFSIPGVDIEIVRAHGSRGRPEPSRTVMREVAGCDLVYLLRFNYLNSFLIGLRRVEGALEVVCAIGVATFAHPPVPGRSLVVGADVLRRRARTRLAVDSPDALDEAVRTLFVEHVNATLPDPYLIEPDSAFAGSLSFRKGYDRDGFESLLKSLAIVFCVDPRAEISVAYGSSVYDEDITAGAVDTVNVSHAGHEALSILIEHVDPTGTALTYNDGAHCYVSGYQDGEIITEVTIGPVSHLERARALDTVLDYVQNRLTQEAPARARRLRKFLKSHMSAS